MIKNHRSKYSELLRPKYYGPSRLVVLVLCFCILGFMLGILGFMFLFSWFYVSVFLVLCFCILGFMLCILGFMFLYSWFYVVYSWFYVSVFLVLCFCFLGFMFLYCSKKETHNPLLFFKMQILRFTR